MSIEQTETHKNLFIVLEGIDHSGKTTLARLIAEKLNGEQLAFPDRSTPTGKKLNEFLRSQSIKENKPDHNKNIDNGLFFNNEVLNKHIHKLFTDTRFEKADFIENTLKHKSIVCDRYWISGAVYSTAKGLDWNWCKETEQGLPVPDLTFFLDVGTDVTFARKETGDEIHDKLELQSKIYNLYKTIDEKMISIKNDTIENMCEEIMGHINNYTRT